MSERANPPTSVSSLRMRLVAICMLLVATASCETQSSPPVDEFQPVVTLRDLMTTMIGPAADVLWEAVTMVETQDGFTEKGPETDEEWEQLRRSATIMLVAANLMSLDGRRVAKVGATASAPDFELAPDSIASLVAQDRETWNGMAYRLQESGQLFLDAIEARNAEPLFDAGGVLDAVCEGCHQVYWYPSN